MTKIITYSVLREHEGDRFYKKGETRDLAEMDAKHLVQLGVLAAPGGGAPFLSISNPVDRKAAAEAEFAEFMKQAETEAIAVARRIETARNEADAKIKEINSEIDDARKAADAALSTIAAEVEKAKSEAAAKSKVEDQPLNKADAPSEKTK